MNWQQVLEDKSLQDLPYKIELNAQGQIVMSPAKRRHSNYQGKIEHLLRIHGPDGEVYPECPIDTLDNVKVAGVVWFSKERHEQTKDEDVCSIAPEICVEIKSDCNTTAEMMFKKDLYFAKGAVEFWLCDEGKISFYDKSGKIDKSKLLPGFPTVVQL